ncbi:hypothetical protein FQN52_009330 [Onygenales sp. PD_12]|nr:hypothetical protein FQN53_000889 [Emmonsiellopsis sp. PD_33]KAK2784060.1 hypothetical protein FQN52_009330 [Onygenales sp. PD_12]
MAGRSVDPLQCFSSLSDNIPSWMTRISDLATHTAAKHAEFSAEYAKLATGEIKPRRRKNSSVHSIRPDDLHPSLSERKSNRSSKENAVEEEDDAYMDPITLLRMSKHYPQEGLQRKRNMPRSAGTDRTMRPRQQVVVHYDSQTQSSLEQLVRDIGGARNNIRKGRMSQMMMKGFGFKSFGMDSKAKSGLSFKSSLDPSMKPSKPSPNKETVFDTVDKQLELAQSLCETAAHQFLRCGDCSTELEKTKEHFNSVLDLTKAEVERLEEEAKTAKELETDLETPKESFPEPILVKEEDKQAPGVVTAIEVDDGSSVSSVSIDITAFRSSRFRA